MKLCATAAPIEVAPATIPALTAAETVLTFAAMVDVSELTTKMSPAAARSLESTYAFVLVRMTLTASAPAPEMANAPAPKLPAALAATAVDVIVAASTALTVMSPAGETRRQRAVSEYVCVVRFSVAA